jgi:hypothetical protein
MGPTERVNAMEQDRQQKSVLDAVQIEQRLPRLRVQPHRGEEAHAPRLRQDSAVIGFLEDRHALLDCGRQAFADRVESSDNCCDCGKRAGGRSCDTARSPRRSTNHSSSEVECGPMTIAVK